MNVAADNTPALDKKCCVHGRAVAVICDYVAVLHTLAAAVGGKLKALLRLHCGIVGDCSVEGFRERDLRFRLARLIDAPAEGGEVFNAPLARGDVDRLADAEEAGGGAAYYDRSDEYNGKEDEYDDGFCFR